MTRTADSLQQEIAWRVTGFNEELSGRRSPNQPEFSDSDTPTMRAILKTYYEFLHTFSRFGVAQGSDVIDYLNESATDKGIQDKSGAIWQNFFGCSIWHRYAEPTPPEVQAEVAAKFFIGYSIWKLLNSEKSFFNDKKDETDSDLLVQLGAEINNHLSDLHFNKDIDIFDNVSKQMYDYFQQSPKLWNLLAKKLDEMVVSLGIDPLIANTRVFYDKETKVLSWCVYDSGIVGEYSVEYSPFGNQQVCAVCGIDGSGKTTLLNGLGMVVLPVAHPEDPRMKTYIEAFSGGAVDYDNELELFKLMRKGVLKKDYTLDAFRFVRNLLAKIDSLHGLFTTFQNIILDRSALTNIAYVDSAKKFGEAIIEVVKDNFLNPRRVVIVDTPVFVAFHRATQGRGDTPDEFDQAEFKVYIRRATMYRILAHVLPNVVSLNTFDAERNEIRAIPDLVAELKKLVLNF